MVHNNIFVAFDSKKTILAVTKMILSEGINVSRIAQNFSEVIDITKYYKSGIIIIGNKFDGHYLNEKIDSLGCNFSVICIGTREQLSAINSERVLKLAVPLNKVDLICSLEMLLTADNSYNNINKKSLDDENIIQMAKKHLIDKYMLNEDQAYKYIQKKSMETSKTMKEISKIILEK